MSTTETGLLLTPGSVGALIGGLLGGRLIAHFGARAQALGGVACAVVAYFILRFLPNNVPVMSIGLVPLGFGIGIALVGIGDFDGDRLVNAQEDAPCDITTYGWDSLHRPTDPRRRLRLPLCGDGPETRSVRSDKNNPDTDGHGLSDLEEFDLKLDPSCPSPPTCAGRDTDADGLSDFEEVRGFTLRDLGILVTDPKDADTDDDKRNDGAEADRFTSAFRWIVRVPGAEPYQAFSAPTDPDSDFDRLVDGDETSWGTDPANWNTDGDTRSDYSEVKGVGARSCRTFG